jgi:hypothetical protein
MAAHRKCRKNGQRIAGARQSTAESRVCRRRGGDPSAALIRKVGALIVKICHRAGRPSADAGHPDNCAAAAGG